MDLSKISRDGKFFFLAYDQGLEHGPSDFNLTTANPEYVFDLTKSGLFTGLITQKGIADKYYKPDLYKTPLIIKLNGKTHYINDEPYSPQICSVEEAVRLRAKAVGYTVYIGSQHEAKMFREFANIVYEAHDLGIPVLACMLSGGSRIGEEDTQTTAYAARVGLELGADLVTVRYAGDAKAMEWVATCGGVMPVCITGGVHATMESLQDEIRASMQAGCKGGAIGRNIWQDEQPLERAKEISTIIFMK